MKPKPKLPCLLVIICLLVQSNSYAKTITHTFDNGDRYIGNVERGKLDGCGIYIWKSGDWYSGQFANSKRTGFGHYYFARTKSQYLGEMLDGEIYGYGVIFFDATQRYEGQFKYGSFDGYGAQYKLRGERVVGQFKNNTLIRSESISTYHLTRAVTAAAQAVNGCPVSR